VELALTVLINFQSDLHWGMLTWIILDADESKSPQILPDPLCEEVANRNNPSEHGSSDLETAALSISNTAISLESANTLSTKPTTEGLPWEESTISQEKLINVISDIAFIPRRHLVYAWIMDQRNYTSMDRLKLRLEAYTKQPWNWWPLMPLRTPPGGNTIKLAWTCVSCTF